MQSRWGAAQVAALRAARGDSQASFARRVGVKEVTVRRWEAGDHSPTQEHAVDALDRLLTSLTPAQRRLFVEALTPSQRAQFDDLVGGTSILCAHCGAHALNVCEESKDMRRRDALEVLGAAVAAGLSGVLPWDRLAAPTVDAGLVAAYEQGMDALASAYVKGDPRVMLPTVAGYADALAPLLDGIQTHELGPRIATVGVDAHAMAGLLAYRAGDRLLTQRHLALAGHVADVSADPVLRGRAWALIAKNVYSPLPDGRGDARRAVALLGRTRALARHADGHTRAWLGASFAEEAAELGDVRLCEWAVEDAGRALDTATGDASGFFSPQSYYGLTEVYVKGVYGRVAGLAGRVDEAERFVSDEIARARNADQRGLALCHLGTIRIENAEPEGACAALGDAVDVAATRGFFRTQRIQALRLKMPPAWGELPCVIDLDERLHAAASRTTSA